MSVNLTSYFSIFFREVGVFHSWIGDRNLLPGISPTCTWDLLSRLFDFLCNLNCNRVMIDNFTYSFSTLQVFPKSKFSLWNCPVGQQERIVIYEFMQNVLEMWKLYICANQIADWQRQRYWEYKSTVYFVSHVNYELAM